jgi:dolichol-phosphate mannosyltransferase
LAERAMSKRFSVVVPVYQNEANLPETIARLLDLRKELGGYDLELVFVDDGSSDGSLAILKEHRNRHPDHIRIVKLTRNFGQTPAIQAGLRHSRGDCVGIISADLQEPCELFVNMIQEWERGAKFVMGERRARAESRRHRLVSGIYWRLIRRFAFPEFPNLGYDFCLLDRQVVEDINRINEKNSSIFVLIYWLGYRPTRVPITRRLRDKGASQWRLLRKITFTIDTLIGFTYVPARLITVMSFALASLGLLYLVSALAIWFWMRAAPPGWMTGISLLTILGAMVLFALGIVSEYLLRILDEARKRPPYVVESVIGTEDGRASPAGDRASRPLP